MPQETSATSAESESAEPSVGDSTAESVKSDFERLAQTDDPGIVAEFIDFLKYNKKWWMAPILIVTLLLIGLAFLTASPVAPFIYTLF